MYLPVVEKVEETILSRPRPHGHETILLVDDDKPLLDVGTRMLEKLGYRVISIDDPFQALDLLESSSQRVDLLITDMTMPGMDGKELALRALKCRPQLPVFLCTGYSDKIDEEEATRLGIRRYLEKPVDQTELANVIREIFDTEGARP